MKSRWSMICWLRQVVLDGDPPEAAEIIRDYADWLPASVFPGFLSTLPPGRSS